MNPQTRQAIRSLAPVNTAVVAVNIIVFIIMSLIGDTENSIFMLTHGASFAPLIVEDHEYWRLLTCMFLHFGVRHLFNNMLVLAFVGDRLEKSAGKVRYMIIYFGGGLLSSLASVGFEYWSGDFYVSAGASGAIFAVVGAVAWIVIRDRGQFQEISMFQIIMFILFSIYLGFQNGGVDNAAHVGGLISGFALGFLICRRKIYRRRQARG